MTTHRSGSELIEPDAVQIHGPLSDELVAQLRQRDVRVIKALSIASDEFYAFNDASVDAVLVDGATPGVARVIPGKS